MRHASIAERSFMERSAMLACCIWYSSIKNMSKSNFSNVGFPGFHCTQVIQRGTILHIRRDVSIVLSPLADKYQTVFASSVKNHRTLANS